MGRKIPGKKHHGVKDPLKQKAKREAGLKNIINAPPKDLDNQEIPKSLERLIKLQNAVKNRSLIQKKKKKKKSNLITLGAEQSRSTAQRHPNSKPEKVVPIFNQKPGESTHQFWERVKRETHNFVKESEFESKFNVEVKRNADTGHIEGIVKKTKDEIELEKLKSKHKNIGKKKKKVSENNVVKLSKSQKKKEKLLLKKQKKSEEDFEDFKTFKDHVEFGEIAHAPPDLKVLPKNKDRVVAANKDKEKNHGLLLNSLLKKDNTSENEVKKQTDKKGKLKNLPLGERRQFEKQQSDVIAAYRLMKTRKGETTFTD